mgnify:CR=1 FL=1
MMYMEIWETGILRQLPDFLEDVSDYVKQGVESGQYTYDRDTGEIVRYRSIRWYEAVAAVVIAGILAGSVCMDIKNAMP